MLVTHHRLHVWFVASSCSRREYLRQCVNLDRVIAPTPLSSLVAGHAVLAFSGLCVPLSLVLGLDTSGPRTLALVLLLLAMATLLLVITFISTIFISAVKQFIGFTIVFHNHREGPFARPL